MARREGVALLHSFAQSENHAFALNAAEFYFGPAPLRDRFERGRSQLLGMVHGPGVFIGVPARKLKA